MKTIRQILFVPPAPLIWAEHIGAFAARGLDVATSQTLSSGQIGRGLADGTWDIGIGVVDDVLAWNAEHGAGLRLIAQLERSTVMRFCVAPACATLADAAAGTIVVDSTTHGFALVLYRALARAGIDWRTCRFECLGGVRQRFEAMLAGTAVATILVPPFDEMARARGFRVLWDGVDLAPDYPGVVVAAQRRWLERHVASATAYLAALLDANAWATRPESAPAARAALVAARYAEPAAERLVRDAVPGLAPSPAGWAETIALRRECGLLAQPEPRAEEVIDTTLLAAAACR